MGKRSQFERVADDFYPTPQAAVTPLLPHLRPRTRFVEPCAGDGALIRHLEAAGHRCVGASDINPRGPFDRADARTVRHGGRGVLYITNPPWLRSILHALIVHLSDQAPTWLLFDADWSHTAQCTPFLPRLRAEVAIGRVKWIAGSKSTGVDNCSWRLFDKPWEGGARFLGRGAPATRGRFA